MTPAFHRPERPRDSGATHSRLGSCENDGWAGRLRDIQAESHTQE